VVAPVRALAVAVTVLLAGCVASAPVETATTAPPLEPMPPPRDVHPDDVVGASAIQDPGFENATHGPLPWRNECIRQWQSGAFRFDEPPVVAGKPCLFYPTRAGTLHWFVLDGPAGDGDAGQTVMAHPLPRDDGFFDWVYLDHEAGNLMWLANGSTPVPVAKVRAADPDRVVLSALRTGETVHVVAADFIGLGQTGGATHAWFRPGEEAQTQSILGQRSISDAPRLRTDGSTAVYVSSGYDASTVYVGTAAFEAHAFPGLYVLSADVLGNEVWGCAARGESYLALHGTATEAGWLWTVEPVAPRPFADLGFTCGAAATAAGPTLVFDAPRLDGGSAFHPLGGSHAATRRGLAWASVPIGFTYHSGADLTVVAGTVVHMGETGNGTGTGGWMNGTELRAGPGGDPTQGPWVRFWGNFGRTAMFVPHAQRLLVVGETWANPPFEYPDFPAERRVSWAVVDVPLPPAVTAEAS
jgi:hypothetical protein